MLAVALEVLVRVHGAVMAALRAPPARGPGGELLYANWDVRHALATERQKVGCLFARLFGLLPAGRF